jgi:hypothetical protein
MAQVQRASCTQYSVFLGFGTTESAGTLMHIQSQDGEGILDFVPGRAFASFAFSSADLEQGETYDVYLGGTATGSLTDGAYQGGSYEPGAYVGDNRIQKGTNGPVFVSATVCFRSSSRRISRNDGLAKRLTH